MQARGFSRYSLYIYRHNSIGKVRVGYGMPHCRFYSADAMTEFSLIAIGLSYTFYLVLVCQ